MWARGQGSRTLLGDVGVGADGRRRLELYRAAELDGESGQLAPGVVEIAPS